MTRSNSTNICKGSCINITTSSLSTDENLHLRQPAAPQASSPSLQQTSHNHFRTFQVRQNQPHQPKCSSLPASFPSPSPSLAQLQQTLFHHSVLTHTTSAQSSTSKAAVFSTSAVYPPTLHPALHRTEAAVSYVMPTLTTIKPY